MTNNEFKVMDWLRKIRDEHSLQSIDKPWEALKKKNEEAVDRFTQRIEKITKKK